MGTRDFIIHDTAPIVKRQNNVLVRRRHRIVTDWEHQGWVAERSIAAVC